MLRGFWNRLPTTITNCSVNEEQAAQLPRGIRRKRSPGNDDLDPAAYGELETLHEESFTS